MIALNASSEQSFVVQECHAFSSTKVTIDLPTDMVLSDASLIDQVFDYTFDVLGIPNVELRIREANLRTRVK